MKARKFGSSLGFAALIGAAGIAALLLRAPILAAEAPVVIPAPALDNPKVAGPAQTAVLSGGCFWGVLITVTGVMRLSKSLRYYRAARAQSAREHGRK